jgi:hypothetical protein
MPRTQLPTDVHEAAQIPVEWRIRFVLVWAVDRVPELVRCHAKPVLSGGIRSEIRTALIVITGHLLARVTRPIALPGWIPTRATLRDRRAARTLHMVAAEIVARARDGGRGRLLDLGAAGGEHEVRDQIVSFLLPGSRGPR